MILQVEITQLLVAVLPVAGGGVAAFFNLKGKVQKLELQHSLEMQHIKNTLSRLDKGIETVQSDMKSLLKK